MQPTIKREIPHEILNRLIITTILVNREIFVSVIPAKPIEMKRQSCYRDRTSMRRPFLAVFFACLILLPHLTVRAQDSAVARSVVIVVDCSYSMRIITPSLERRLDVVKRGLRNLLSRPPTKTEWAMVSFTDSEEVAIDSSFTSSPRSLLAIVERLEVGRLSPIETSLDLAADYLIRKGRASEKAVLLVSDGIPTESSSFQVLLSSSYEKNRIRLFVLGFDDPSNPALTEPLVRLARYTGGGFYTFDRLEELAGRLAGKTIKKKVIVKRKVVRTPIQNPTQNSTQNAKSHPITPMIGSGSEINMPKKLPRLSGKLLKGRSQPMVFVWMLAAGTLLIGLSIFLHRYARKQERRNEEVLANRRTFLSLSIKRYGGKEQTYTLKRSPVTVGNSQDCDIRLDVKTGGWRDVFTYSWDEGVAHFNSKRKFLLNGVAVKEKELRGGDRLKFGEFSLTFNGLKDEAVEVPTVRKYGHIPLSAGCFLLIFSLLLVTIRKAHTIPGPPAEASLPYSQASQSATLEQIIDDPATDGLIREAGENAYFTYQVSIAERPPLRAQPAPGERHPSPQEQVTEEQVTVTVEEEIADSGPLEAGYDPELAPAPIQVAPLRRIPIHVIAPSEKIDFFKADILFFHAHPDDESLDFAGFIAKARRNGKRIVTVLFTDGESGLDQFPNRRIDGSLPLVNLQGEELAAARVEEAKAALSVLGSEVYIRLGLTNHPYNTSRDYLSVRRVIDEWGGEKMLFEKVRRILEGFRPTVVVSSDFNTEAFEHFEHKAVGSIVHSVLRYLMARGNSFIQGYLVSVDPLQKKKLYPSLERIDMMEKDPVTGLTYREIQFNALKEHQTQGDASLIGVELLPHFRWEQYYPHIWKLDTSVEGYINSKN